MIRPRGQQMIWGDANTTNGNQMIWGDTSAGRSVTDALPARGRRLCRRRRRHRRGGRRRRRCWRCRERRTPLSGRCFTLLALVAGRFPLRVPGTNAWFSISDTFFITSALLFGPAPATVTMAIDSMVMSYGRSQSDWRRLLFNGSAPAIAFWAARRCSSVLADRAAVRRQRRTPTRWSCRWRASPAVYFVLNSGLTAFAVALEKRTSPLAVWRSHFGDGVAELLRGGLGGVPAGSARRST